MLATIPTGAARQSAERKADNPSWFARGLALCTGLTPMLVVAYAFLITGDPAVRAQIVVAGCERLVGLFGAAVAAYAVHRLGQHASGSLAVTTSGSDEISGTARAPGLRDSLAA